MATENIILDLSRAIRSDVGDIKADIREIKEWLGLLENQYASLSNRIDRTTGDIERIKRRLELTEA